MAIRVTVKTGDAPEQGASSFSEEGKGSVEVEVNQPGRVANKLYPTSTAYAGAYLDEARSKPGKWLWQFTDDLSILRQAKTKMLKRTPQDLVVHLEKLYPCPESGCSFAEVNGSQIWVDTSFLICQVKLPLYRVYSLARRYSGGVLIPERFKYSHPLNVGDVLANRYEVLWSSRGVTISYREKEIRKSKKNRVKYEQGKRRKGKLTCRDVYNIYSHIYYTLKKLPIVREGVYLTCSIQLGFHRPTFLRMVPKISKLAIRLSGKKPMYRNTEFKRYLYNAYLYIPGLLLAMDRDFTSRQGKEDSPLELNFGNQEVAWMYQFVRWLIWECKATGVVSRGARKPEISEVNRWLRKNSRWAHERFVQYQQYLKKHKFAAD